MYGPVEVWELIEEGEPHVGGAGAVAALAAQGGCSAEPTLLHENGLEAVTGPDPEARLGSTASFLKGFDWPCPP